jgi:hypothetical protein
MMYEFYLKMFVCYYIVGNGEDFWGYIRQDLGAGITLLVHTL